MSTATATAAAGVPRGPAEEAEPRVTARTVVAFFALVLGMFMAILDIQIVASSLDQIRAGLSAGADEISWVQTSYLIAEVIMIPLSGFLARALSTRILFTASAVGFTLASVLAATAQSIEEMIVYRAFQGFIGGGMIPTTFAAAYAIFPRRMQGAVMALIGLTVTLAPTIGPTVGGYLTEHYSWHWLFLVNIVPGILASAIAWSLIDFDEPEWHLLARFDYAGLVFMAVGLGCLQYVLEEGQRNDWFEDRAITTAAVASAVAGLLFIWRSFTFDNPIVDFRVFHDRNFAVGSLMTFLLGIGLYGLTYLLPVFLARVRGYNALQIGETVWVTGAFMFLAAPFVSRTMTRSDARIMIAAGLAIFALASWQLVGVTRDWGFRELFVPQALRGVGLMMAIAPINHIAMGTLPRAELKNASGLFNLTRNLGGAFGLAVITTLLSSRADFHYARLAEHVTWSSALTEERLSGLAALLEPRLGAQAESGAVALLALFTQREALVMAFADVFLFVAAATLIGVVLAPLLRRPPDALS